MLNVKDNKTMMYTDLAVEIQEECSGRQGEIPGVVLEQYKKMAKVSVSQKYKSKRQMEQNAWGGPQEIT